MSLVRILLAVFLPPVAVLLQAGISKHLLINIVLCFIGGLPGMIHALWLVMTSVRS
ncbi:MAG: YqaE/Pmp3 family membrane protein [Myxococcota bacterium]|nr:YqaE/Pmp3 family membrane protein [Myxococcota bacterium]